MQLYGINLSMKLIDDFVIIPGGVGSLLTGLLYSIFTNWGWFKHKWVTTKWAINFFFGGDLRYVLVRTLAKCNATHLKD